MPLRRNRNFVLLWVGQLSSLTGSSASTLAYPLVVLALSGSATAAGLVGAASMAGRIVFQLPGGAWADRWDRRRVMMVSDVVGLTVAALVAVGLLFDAFPWWALLAAVFMDGAASVTFSPAESAAIPHVVPRSQLMPALAQNQARLRAARLAGPPLGGALLGLARLAPFIADAVSYAVSLATVTALRGQLGASQPGLRRPLVAEIREGLHHVVRDPFRRALMVSAALVNCGYAGVDLAMIVSLRLEGWSSAIIGLVLAALGVAGLIGSFLAGPLQRRIAPVPLVVTLSWTFAATTTAAAFLIASPLVAVPICVGFVFIPSVSAVLQGHQLATTPDELRGRVTNSSRLMSSILLAVAPVAAGVIVEYSTGTVAVLVFAGVLAAAALVVSVSRGIRQMRPLDDQTGEAM